MRETFEIICFWIGGIVVLISLLIVLVYLGEKLFERFTSVSKLVRFYEIFQCSITQSEREQIFGIVEKYDAALKESYKK